MPVAAVEEHLVGGECPYWGCIPSKMMIRAANLLTEGRRIAGMAGSSVISPSWAPVAKRIRDEATDNWDDKVAADRFTGLGGTLVRGRARISAPGEVSVGDDVLRATRGIVIGTGTAPAIPPIDGLAQTPYWTNHDAIETEDVPRSLLILGGGAICAELGQVFARFGSAVTIIEAMPRLLPLEEPEAGELIEKVFRAEGIAVSTGTGAESVRHDGREFTVTLAGGRQHSAARLLVATGRKTDLAALGVAQHRARRDGPVHRGRRADAGSAGRLGPRGRRRQGRLHAHVDVSRPHHPRRPARPSAPSGRVSRGAAGHLHRSGDRQRRHDRGAGQSGARGSRPHRDQPAPGLRARLDPQGRQRRLHQARRSTASAASSSALPRPGRRAARCSACSRSPCTPGSPCSA